MSPLQQLDAVDVVTDLHQIPHHELGASSFGAGRDLAAARHVSFGQDGRVKRPPATRDTFMKDGTGTRVPSRHRSDVAPETG